ncbi:IspD/TarI family cytidylyltransferase [Streptococcus parauberis]|uniref:IspD/TarI family cytidylyltransferase n=1 Tax=Streptococcus parauberis TaxID=1348 RepID=UPI000C1C85FD|nr:IspD/TarI family cytidylyltransferase [Streptococcus parauberis]PIO78237.1 putative 2-C-methyl-D-erythritol 4-phosphate cytidylyltransferase 2 [Streptococcus parauberis]POS67807.1 putative 2-C-methyl-D-erythritol 4-phosphate cytidylyltransferase 2 [Streptococcus parauberis]
MSKVSAVIFAGGTGSRMNTKTKPKQFLELHGKPIIIHTLEHFENHPEVDQVVVVCIEGWENYLKKLLTKFHITKVIAIVNGGETGQMSIFNGLNELMNIENGKDDIVLIHDGVRPLINDRIISDNISLVRQKGNAITVKPVIETVIKVGDSNEIIDVVDRDSCQTAVAPQSFLLNDIYNLHLMAQNEEKFNLTDSASLARYYGKILYTVMGGPENIKITTPSDFYIFRAIYDLRENEQILGYSE